MVARSARFSVLGVALLVALTGGTGVLPFGLAPVDARSTSGNVLGGPSANPDAVDCKNFLSQADAQAVLDADPSDPYKLDQGGKPGVACETQGATGHGPLVTCRDLQTAETAQALLVADSDDSYGLDPDGDRVACNGNASGGSTTDHGGQTGAGTGTRAGGRRGTGGGAGDAGNAEPPAATVPASEAAAAPPPDPGAAVTGPTDCRIAVQTDRSFAGVDCAEAGVIAGHVPSKAGSLVDFGPTIISRVQTAVARAEDAAITKRSGSTTVQANAGTSADGGGRASANANGGAVAIGTISPDTSDQSSSSGRRSSTQGQAGDPTTSAQRMHGGKHRHRGSQRQHRHKPDRRP